MRFATAVSEVSTDLLAGPYLLGIVIMLLGLYTVTPVLTLLGLVLVLGSLSSALYLAWQD